MRQGSEVLPAQAAGADGAASAAASLTPPNLKLAAQKQDEAASLRQTARGRLAEGSRLFSSLASILTLVDEARAHTLAVSQYTDKLIEAQDYAQASEWSERLSSLRTKIHTLETSEEYRIVHAQVDPKSKDPPSSSLHPTTHRGPNA